MGWHKIHNRLCFPLLVVKFAIDGFCITHDPKEIKKKPVSKQEGTQGHSVLPTILKKQNKYSQAREMGGTSGFFCLLHPDLQQSYNQSVMRYLRGWKSQRGVEQGEAGQWPKAVLKSKVQKK